MSWITTKLLSYVSGGLLSALLAASAFSYLQTTRLEGARNVIAKMTDTVTLLTQRVHSDRALIATRDQLIGKQNAAVLAMHKAAEADRAAYAQRIAAAEKVAKVYKAQAADIMARSTTATDELERSRAALALIEEMIGAEYPQTN